MLMGLFGRAKRKYIPWYTVYDNQTFEIMSPYRAHNFQHARYLGEPGWYRLECRKDNRRPEDHDFVDRIGLDSWRDPVPNGDKVFHTKFSVVFGEGCVPDPTDLAPQSIANQPLYTPCWLNFFEHHAKPKPQTGEYEPSGPIRFTWEWSYLVGGPVFRIWTHLLEEDAYGLAIGSRDELIRFEASPVTNPEHQLQLGVRYDFEVELYSHETAGFVHVWKDGDLILDLNNIEFGYGVERRTYPVYRIYRAARNSTAFLLGKIEDATVYRPPAIPGVTRGPELLRDGQFTLNEGAWSDQYSAAGCSFTWTSASGGRMVTSTPTPTGSPSDPAARIRRRLDILEVGETYELKFSGTAGLGASPVDGAYWPESPVKYLMATEFNVDGSELVRQFVATEETLFLGTARQGSGYWLDGVSLKRVIS